MIPQHKRRRHISIFTWLFWRNSLQFWHNVQNSTFKIQHSKFWRNSGTTSKFWRNFGTTFKSTACKCRWVWLGKSWGNVFSLIIEDMMQHFVGNITHVKYWTTLLISGDLIWVSIWLKLLWCKWYTVYDEWGEVWRSTKRQNTWMEIGPSGGNVIVVVVNVK